MSILLEALKKSEQSRKLGDTPTLETPVENLTTAADSSGRLIPLLLITLSAIVMTWFGWQQFRVPEPVDTTAEPALVSEREQSEPEGNDETDQKSRTMTENYQAKAVEPDSSDEEKQRLKQSFESFKGEPDSEQKKTDAEFAAASSGSDAEIKSPVTREPDEDEDKEVATRRVRPHIAEPISYWELPQGVRDGMPEIRITVLVFAEDPEDRFLLSNGQRFEEKDEVDSGLVLDEIRRDGAVFKYRKYRFLVKG